MSNLHALNVAVDMASRKRDDARKALQTALAHQQAAHTQLDQLENYAKELDGRWGAQANTAVKPEVMYHHYQFMDRLGHAAGIQNKVLDDKAVRVDAARQALIAAELRVTSLRKVVESRRQEQELTQMRREQKQTDERAALQYRSSRTDSEREGD
jgi:flagellar FliJ protein